MTRTYVITGGTDGIGAALARFLFRRGDHVVILGTRATKAEPLLAEAGAAKGSAAFVQADLGLVPENRRVVRELTERYPVIDGLVLCARFFQTKRRETAEGFEHNFALYYLSRLILGYGLRENLEKSDRPVIVNVAGPGHDTPIAWDDLQTAVDYDGVRAMFAAGRYNDLLGVTFAERHGTTGAVRYVLFHPGTVSTGFVGEYDPPTARFIEQQKRTAKPATEVVPPLVRLLDSPPPEPLSAFYLDSRINVASPVFSREAAARLASLTDRLLAQHQP